MPPDPSPPPTTARIEVFRSGTFTPMQGDPITYSAADLRAIADAYDPDVAPVPIVVGHPATDAPAFAWVRALDYDAVTDRLHATISDIAPEFATAVRAGRYRKVSMALHRPGAPENPVPGTWYPRHIGFLGGAAPAVTGLKVASFATPADAVFTAAFGSGEVSAGLFRSLRDFVIEQFGREAADKALPSFSIDWLSEADDPPSPRFSSPPQPQDPIMPPTPDPAAAARAADLDRREAALRARETAAAHDANVAFAAALVADGRLLPASQAQVVAILDALPADGSVSFAAGDGRTMTQPTADALRAILTAQPQTVTYGAHPVPPGPGDGGATVAFASDGKAVDRDQLALHVRAEAWMRAHPGVTYIDAVMAVSAG